MEGGGRDGEEDGGAEEKGRTCLTLFERREMER